MASWREAQHRRVPKGSATGGRFVKSLMTLRPGETATTNQGVRIKSGRVRQGRRSRRLFSVEGGSVHRDPAAAVREAESLGGPVVVGAHSGPSTHTGWLTRYRKMSKDELEMEDDFIDNYGNDPSAVDQANIKVRRSALTSALAEARGEKRPQKRPGARKVTFAEGDLVELPDGTTATFSRHGSFNTVYLKKTMNGSIVVKDLSEIKHVNPPKPKPDKKKKGSGKYSPAIEAEAEDFRKFIERSKSYSIATETNRELGRRAWKLAESIRSERVQEQATILARRDQARVRLSTLTPHTPAYEQALKDRDSAQAELDSNTARAAATSAGKRGHRSEKQVEGDIDLGRIRLRKSDLLDEIAKADEHPDGMFNDHSRALRKQLEKEKKATFKLLRELALAKKQAQDYRSADYSARPNATDLREALALVRPGFGEGKLKVKATGTDARKNEDLLHIAALHLPKEWIDAINARETSIFTGRAYKRIMGLKLGLTTGRDRANYKNHEAKISLHRGSDSYSTALHEVGHAVEYTNSRVREAEKVFYYNRTHNAETQHIASLEDELRRTAPLPSEMTKAKAEKMLSLSDEIERLKASLPRRYQRRRLRDITGIKDYENHEVAIEDQFTSPYMGKDYGGQAYELLTMGLEGVFFNKHGMSEKDKDMRHFILGLLVGA